jgi:hypothetical protein
VPAAVDLQEHARLGHPFAATAMSPRTASPHRRQTGLGEDPPERPLGHDDSLALGEQVREMGAVDTRIRRPGELDEPGPQHVVEPIGGDPSLVAMDERSRALVGVVARQEPAHRADREVQVGGRLPRGQFTGQDVVEHPQPLLCSSVQCDRLPRLHELEGDKVAGRLWVTDSLAVHSLTTTR